MHRFVSFTVVSTLFVASILPAHARPGGRPGPASRGTAGSRVGALSSGVSRGNNLPSSSRVQGSAPRQIQNGTLDARQQIGGVQSQLQSRSTTTQQRFGISSGQLSNLQGQTQQLRANYAPEHEPFSPAWYADHPKAWQYTHPHADVWAAATVTGVTRWFGWTTAPYGYTAGTTANVGEDLVTAEPSTTVEVESATTYPLQGIEWLPLGVYAFAPAGQDEATVLVQLSVNKQGEVRGNYFDFVTEQSLPISGNVNRSTQRATFAVEGSKTAFNTTMGELLNATTPVALNFADGRGQQSRLVRLQSKQ